MAHASVGDAASAPAISPSSPLLADLGATTERLFSFDPVSRVLKLSLLAEREATPARKRPRRRAAAHGG